MKCKTTVIPPRRELHKEIGACKREEGVPNEELLLVHVLHFLREIYSLFLKGLPCGKVSKRGSGLCMWLLLCLDFLPRTAQLSCSVMCLAVLPRTRPGHAKLAGEILRKTAHQSCCALLPASSCFADKKWLALQMQRRRRPSGLTQAYDRSPSVRHLAPSMLWKPSPPRLRAQDAEDQVETSVVRKRRGF